MISNVNLGAGGVTVLPASSEVWVQGKVTGAGTTVAASINGGEPILMNRRGEDFGYMLPLDAGTNVIVLVATAEEQPQQQSRRRRQVNQNESPDQSSVLLPVVPSGFQIWGVSPPFGTFTGGQNQWVTGYMDRNFEGVAITNATLNGQHMGLGMGEEMWFGVTLTCTNPSAMTLTMTLYLVDGRQIDVPFWYLEGYQIASKTVRYQNTVANCNNQQPAFIWYDYAAPTLATTMWTVLQLARAERLESYWAPSSVTDTNWIWDVTGYGPTTNLFAAPTLASVSNYWGVASWQCVYGGFTGSHWEGHTAWPPVDLRFGTNSVQSEADRSYTYTGSQPPCPGGGDNALLGSKTHGLQWIDDQAQMVVNWPLHYPQGKQVLMTFTQVDYTRLNNEAYDPTQVLYHGQPPDVITTNNCGNGSLCFDLSYIVAVSGTSFTLDETAFTWPTSTLVYDTNITASDQGCWTQTNSMSGATHHMGFSGFHNDDPKIITPSGTAVSTDNIQRDSWKSTYWWDFQAVVGGVIQIQGEMNPPNFGWKLTPGGMGYLDYPNLTPQSSPIYHANPTCIPDLSADVTLTMREGLDENRVLRIYKDNLARDMENFGTISCKGDKGVFWKTHFGTVTMDHNWNCFGSVKHALDGQGDGYVPQYLSGLNSLPSVVLNNWGSATFYYSATQSPVIPNLQRGAIVAFCVTDCTGLPTALLQHVATATGSGSDLWGANNSSFANGPTWFFATQPVENIMKDCLSYFSNCKTFYIIIFTKNN